MQSFENMLKNTNISLFYQLTMALLVITLLAMAAYGGSLQKNLGEKVAIEVSTDAEEDEEQPRFLVNYQAIVPVSQLPVFIPFSFSFKLSLVEVLERKDPISVPVFINAYFFTLFRQIISPNAP